MPTEGISRVREAEDRAEDIIDEAHEAADRLLADARIVAVRRVSDAEARAGREGRAIAGRLEGETAREMESRESEAAKAAAVVGERAAVNHDRAVGVVLEALRGGFERR